MRKLRQKGFTLVEILIAMVALGVATTAIISLQAQVMRGAVDNREIVQGNQLLQQCAETILATRRRLGYTSVSDSLCSNSLHTLESLSTAVSLHLDSSLLSSSSCTSSSAVCNVSIELKKQTAPATKVGLARVSLRLYNY